MQEEVTQKSVALVIRTGRMTADALRKAILEYIRHRIQNRMPPTGKTTVRRLLRKTQGASTISVDAGCIREFERTAKKYGVQYAIKKDKSESPPKYVVFFKAGDTDVIHQAFKEFVGINERKRERPSLRQKLKALVQSLSSERQHKERQRSREKEHPADR